MFKNLLFASSLAAESQWMYLTTGFNQLSYLCNCKRWITCQDV